MRTAVLIGVVLLVAGCSGATVQSAEPTATGSSGQPQPSRVPAATVTPTAPPAAPVAGAPISAVIGWVEAGARADAAGYHRVTRDGVATDLGDDIGFTVPAGTPGGAPATRCVTDARFTGGALACLVALKAPPPPPADVYGQWKGNWVDFDGAGLQVGSAHGDPGPFGNGDGPALPDGATLSFGDYRCRTARTDLVCVNYAHRSAVRLGPAGVTPFGCLRPAAPPTVGETFGC